MSAYISQLVSREKIGCYQRSMEMLTREAWECLPEKHVNAYWGGNLRRMVLTSLSFIYMQVV